MTKCQNNKIIAIIGPTASGKSDLGIHLAKKFNGEIISVDSRQVYRGMNIGTGKVKGKVEKISDFRFKISDLRKNHKSKIINQKCKILYPYISEGIKHWLIDIVDPKKDRFSVAEFQDLAYQVIFDIFRRGKLPILVGGSMLYMDAVLEGYQIPRTNLSLRAKLEKFTTEELLKQLKESDLRTYKKIDHGNRRRILRALESYLLNRRSLHEYKKEKPNFQYLILGVNCPRDTLYERIDNRVDQRVKQGMIEEVEGLIKKGVSYKKLGDFGLEYRYISNYLKSQNSNLKINKTKQEMIQNLKFKIHAFARRQLVWWRRNKKIQWLNITHEREWSITLLEAEKLSKNFLENS